ncbi:hypothetical protein [Colwellia psychrerythraea]|nr:hypothetical protein [Colwellia psychrerythraea]
MELARTGIRGCAILSFDISDLGKTENVEIINSIPNTIYINLVIKIQ